jgi:glycosyltransferase involved in cell wall biosynthesis
MKIDLLFLSCNRLHYTKHSIPALLADPSEEFSLTIWDNGSTDGSREFLESVQDSRIVKKVLSPTNVGAYPVVNQALKDSSADLIGFVADDLLVTPGWTRIIGTAHAEIPELGRIACWHFAPEEFDYERAKHKIQTFGRHKLLRHPWTNGCGLTKMEAIRKVGLLRPNETESAYWRRIALDGYVVGYYYPLVLVEHMDYPWSPYFPYKDDLDKWFKNSSTARQHGVRTMADAKAWHRRILTTVLDGPWDVKYYVGLRGKLRRGKDRLRRTLTGSRF